MEYEYLAHHGIKGQKWGVRRFQNPDGTRTAAGKRREHQSAALESKQDAYISAKRNEKKVYAESAEKWKNMTNRTEADMDEYDRVTNEAFNKRAQAFKASKAELKNSRSAGRKVATVLMNGPFGTKAYNNLRASGYSAGAAWGMNMASSLVGGPFGQLALGLITNKRGA